MVLLLYFFVRALFYLFVLTVAGIGLMVYFIGKLVIDVVEIIADKCETKREVDIPDRTSPKPQSFYSNRR